MRTDNDISRKPQRKKSTFLITGGAGFIGSHIADRLIAMAHKVIIADDFSTGTMKNVNPKSIVCRINISDRKAVRDVFKRYRIDYCVHEAAKINLNIMLEDPIKDVSSSVLGTLNLLQCCAERGIKKFIYASSVAVYGRPLRVPVCETDDALPIYSYGIAKRCAEEYVRFYSDNYGLNHTILRYANVYGPRQPIYGEVGVIAIYTDKFISGKPFIIYGDGNHMRDFVFIDDVVDATIRAVAFGDGGTFNIGSGAGVTVNTVFDIFNRLAGNNLDVIRKKERVGELGRFYCSSDKARRVLGWKAHTGLCDGIFKTIFYYRQRRRSG